MEKAVKIIRKELQTKMKLNSETLDKLIAGN
jgi:ribosomal protein L31E